MVHDGLSAPHLDMDEQPAVLENRPDPVFVRQIKLNNFRNYEHLNLNLTAKHIVLTGENGAGKTTTLSMVSGLLRPSIRRSLPRPRESASSLRCPMARSLN